MKKIFTLKASEDALVQHLFKSYAKVPFTYKDITGDTIEENVELRVQKGYEFGLDVYINNVNFSDKIKIERYMDINVYVLLNIILELQDRKRDTDFEFLAICQKIIQYIENDDIIEINFDEDGNILF